MPQIPYDREAAAAYAAQYALAYNPAYGSWAKAGGDCANFVSQCLRAGGLPMKRTGLRQWYYDTTNGKYTGAASSWKGAQSLRVFLKYNQEAPCLPIDFVPSACGLQKGDILWALNDDGISKADRSAHHVVLVDRVTPEGEIYIYGHTANRRNERWAYPWEDTLYGKLGDYILLPEQELQRPSAQNDGETSQSSSVSGCRLLRYRAGAKMQHGSDVKDVQSRLLALGYDPGPLDGWYGPLTSAAVKTFQLAQNIQADGIVGPQTRSALQE